MNRSSNFFKNSAGFTVIEILVIIGVLALLSATLIPYTHTGERQIVLLKEQARIIHALSRAKYLGLGTFGKTGVPCGYGVHFETPRSFLIFKDVAGNCQLSDKRYSGASEVFESFQLEETVKFSQLTLSDIVFIPPEPLVVITPSQDQATIIIETIDAASSVTVKINSAGQISR